MDATEEYEVSCVLPFFFIYWALTSAAADPPARRYQRQSRCVHILIPATLAASYLADEYQLVLDPSKHIGVLIPNTLPKPTASAPAPPPTSIAVPQKTTSATGEEEYIKPDLEQVLSLHDFEAVARRTMSKRGWNYYSSCVPSSICLASPDKVFDRSGADDEITMVCPISSCPAHTNCPAYTP